MSLLEPRPKRPFRLIDVPANVIFYLSAIITAVLCGVSVLPAWLLAPLDRKRQIARAVMGFWIWNSLALMRATRLWRITVEGREHFRSDFQGVFAPNHCSQLDILLLHAVGIKATWVSKNAVLWMPFIGWALAASGYIGLKRADTGSIRAMTRKLDEWLRIGTPVVMFPEGTRSRTGEVLPFKSGPFQVARRAGVGVIPVAVSGTGHAMPPKAIWVRGGVDIRVTFLPEIPASDVSQMRPEELADRARAAVVAALSRP